MGKCSEDRVLRPSLVPCPNFCGINDLPVGKPAATNDWWVSGRSNKLNWLEGSTKKHAQKKNGIEQWEGLCSCYTFKPQISSGINRDREIGPPFSPHSGRTWESKCAKCRAEPTPSPFYFLFSAVLSHRTFTRRSFLVMTWPFRLPVTSTHCNTRRIGRLRRSIDVRVNLAWLQSPFPPRPPLVPYTWSSRRVCLEGSASGAVTALSEHSKHGPKH